MRARGGAAVVLAVLLAGCGAGGGSGGGAGGGSGGGSGIAGRAVIGPTCPVQRSAHSCRRGYRTTLSVSGGGVRRRIHTAADGSFRADLPPGRYVLVGTNAGLPRWRALPLEVKPGRFTRVTFTFDSGIR